MSRNFASSFLVLSLLVPSLFACSRQLNCATEGCKKDGAVSFRDDDSQEGAPTENSNDATVANKDEHLEGRFRQLLDRLGLSEAIAVLQAKVLALHEVRITALEEKVNGHDSKIDEIWSQIDAHGLLIEKNSADILDVQQELQGELDALAALQASDIALVQEQITGLQSSFTQQIQGLSDDTEAKIQVLLDAMAAERTRVDAADQAIADAAQANLDALHLQLSEEIARLDAADASQLAQLLGEISRLDGRVDELTEASASTAQDLLLRISKLQRELRRDQRQNRAAYLATKAAISSLEHELEAALNKLKKADSKIFARLKELSRAQDSLRDEIDALDAKVERYKKIQKFIDLAFATAIQGLDQRLTKVKNKLQSQINEQAYNLNILSESVAGLSEAIDSIKSDMTVIQSTLLSLQDSLSTSDEEITALEQRISSLESDLSAKSLAINAAIESLQLAIDAKSECAFGSVYGQGRFQYRTLTCDSVTIAIVVGEVDDGKPKK